MGARHTVERKGFVSRSCELIVPCGVQWDVVHVALHLHVRGLLVGNMSSVDGLGSGPDGRDCRRGHCWLL